MTKNEREFIKQINKWQEYFGLFNWEIHFDYTYKKEVRATVSYSYCGKIATIMAEKKWLNSKKTTNKELSRVAFHEVAEIFLSRIAIDLEHYISKDFAEAEVHNVIRFLEHKLLGKNL